MSAPDVLITDCTFELVEDFHSIGSGRYSGKITLPVDISACFPYLNAVLTESTYDHENHILIGVSDGRRYAFRPHEIQLGGIPEPERSSEIVDKVVALVNRVWHERDSITPSLKERELPAAFEIYQLLPRTNCRECGYTTCLACAADIRAGSFSWEDCPCLGKPEYAGNREKLRTLLGQDG